MNELPSEIPDGLPRKSLPMSQTCPMEPTGSMGQECQVEPGSLTEPCHQAGQACQAKLNQPMKRGCQAELNHPTDQTCQADSSPESGQSPCATCGVKNCPTRGVVLERPENALPPGRMVFSSVLVFLLPLVMALAGALLLPDWCGSETTTKTARAALQWGGAAAGFCVGCLFSAFVSRWQAG